MQDTTVLDAIAEHALSCYYREAGIPQSQRAEDDAHALLNSYNKNGCLVAAAEARYRGMSDTRTACMAWTAMASDCAGFTSLEAADVFADAVGMVTGDALAKLRSDIETERAALAEAGDDEAAHAWGVVLASADRRIASDDERCAAYAAAAMKASQHRAIAAANGLTLAVEEYEDAITALADAIVATRFGPMMARAGFRTSLSVFNAADAAARAVGGR